MIFALTSLTAALVATPLEPSTIAPLALPVQSSSLIDRNFSYDYVEGGLSFGDATGFEVGVSTELDGPWIGVGRFQYLNDDEAGIDADLISISGGAGYVHPIQENIDLVTTAELEYAKVSVDGGGDDSEFGVRILGGGRFVATEQLELFASLSYRSVYDAELGFIAGGRYQLNERWSALARVEIDDEFTQFLIGARYGF